MYRVETNRDGEPTHLYWHHDSRVAVWYQGDWRETLLSLPELEGLGVAANYRRIREEDTERVLELFGVGSGAPIVTYSGYL